MPNIRTLFQSYLDSPDLPSAESLLSHLESAIAVLEGESPSYRPPDAEKRPGGLLDFLAAPTDRFPVLIVPDLHGRGNFLLDILDFSVDGRSVLSLLEKGEIYLVCVGDIFHSENRGKFRWKKAFEEYMKGNLVNEFLREEMRENLSLLEMVLSLKSAFAGHFHVLKGNHENVMNENQRSLYGNVPFRKFCDEGNMVADFIRHFYDDLILHEISCFEKALPICSVFRDCVISHAEPADFFTREEIINYHEIDSYVTFALTWTANDDAKEGTVSHLYRELLGAPPSRKPFYFTGHRPVLGSYALRQEGALVQIHNPEIEQVALLLPNQNFDPERDIIDLKTVR
ncbi:MAG: metallophosphoesterase [Treponema sp.]|nr:metallophosphoesterase [Treponema sp.]